jgi:hypothetical protein
MDGEDCVLGESKRQTVKDQQKKGERKKEKLRDKP